MLGWNAISGCSASISSRSKRPTNAAEQIVRDLPSAESSVTAITRMYINERYGPDRAPSTPETPQGQVADRAWSDARGNILQRFLRRVLMPWRRK